MQQCCLLWSVCMKKILLVLGLFVCFFVFGCNDGDDEVSIGQWCSVTEFKNYCNGDTLIYCSDSESVSAMRCDEVCASMNGTPACRFLCTGTKVGDVSYACESWNVLLENTCVAGDGGVLLRIEKRVDCSSGTRCVTEGTTAGCKPEN